RWIVAARCLVAAEVGVLEVGVDVAARDSVRRGAVFAKTVFEACPAGSGRRSPGPKIERRRRGRDDDIVSFEAASRAVELSFSDRWPLVWLLAACPRLGLGSLRGPGKLALRSFHRAFGARCGFTAFPGGFTGVASRF